MRNYLAVFLILGVASSSLSQSNTFPSSGNVGIGTSSPSSKLEVVGTVELSATSGNIINANGSGVQVLQLSNDDIRGVNTLVISDIGSGEGIQWPGDINISVYENSTSGYNAFQFNSTSLFPFAFMGSKVGIGTTTVGTSTSGLLYVGAPLLSGSAAIAQFNGFIRTGPALFHEGTTSNTGQIYYDTNGLNINTSVEGAAGRKILLNGGDVGIGTATPASKLDVNGSVTVGVLGNINFRREDGGINGAVGFLGGRQMGIRNTSGNGVISFHQNSGSGTEEVMRIHENGFLGIGTITPDAKLTVNGTIHTKEVKVDLNVPGPDYVFEENYPLRSLEETKAYIEQNKHLPGIPSSSEMQQNGVNLLEMNMKLLEKVEELTLHLIEQDKKNAALEDIIFDLCQEIDQLKSVIK